MASGTAAARGDWQVVCLCAAWCGVCREWDPVFQALRERFPAVTFAWIDVEDEADAMGDLDIETFPTLLVAHDSAARFLGPVQPSAVQVSRLLDGLAADPSATPANAAEATGLLHRLQAAMLLKR